MKNIITLTLIISLIACFYLLENPKVQKTKAIADLDVSPGIGTKADRFARFTYMRKLLADPATGNIPPFMRQKELMFAKTMQASMRSAGNFDMVSRGPFNVGGRTRAFAVDIDNDSIMLAGSVSGGVWKSVDAGASWYRVSSSIENLSVTTLIQDPRPGHHQEWYYGTGELFGASQSGPGAFYLGNGVYKSVDNGETWTSIPATAPNSPQSFNTPWEGIWRIAIDPSNLSQTELYVATYTTIYRSVNGGSTWTSVLAPPNFNNISYFTDVSVTSDGVVYAGMSKENTIISNGLSPVGGIWRSDDGTNYTNILPSNFPPTYNRIVMGINPSDENEIYFLISNVDSAYGKECNTVMQQTSWNALWRYNYISGNGSGAGGSWTDLSDNIYVGPDDYDDYNPQSGYNMCVGVSPTNPDIVVIGGTNLYRSLNGFRSTDSVSIIGGFKIGMQWPIFEDYPGHHADQHGVFFHPNDGNVMYSCNDGGMARTNNLTDTMVTWTSLENGYISSQFYHVAINMHDTSKAIVGGLQDNGNYYTSTDVDTDPWIRPHNGDGGPSFFAKDNDFLMLSVQLGVLLKVQIDSLGNELAYERVDPDLDRSVFEFIHPYALDPNDDDYLYLPAGKKLWVKNDLTSVALNNGYVPSFSGWTALNDSLPTGNLYFTAIATTADVQKKLYLGTNNEKIYRVDDASDPNSALVDISDPAFPNAYMKCIAVDPTDSDKLIVVFSAYQVYSLFYTDDGGSTWTKIGGNLEQNINGTGNGPSVRSAALLPLMNGKNLYVVGTSIGAFFADTLMGHSTVWNQISPGGIANNIVTDVRARPADELLVLATHGNGVYSGTYDATSVGIQEMTPPLIIAKLFPNPVDEMLNLEFRMSTSGRLEIQIMDELGRRVKVIESDKFYTAGDHSVSIATDELNQGMYYVLINSEQSNIAAAFLKL